jgi:enolase
MSSTISIMQCVKLNFITGIYEALELRDKDPKAYHGKGK